MLNVKRMASGSKYIFWAATIEKLSAQLVFRLQEVRARKKHSSLYTMMILTLTLNSSFSLFEAPLRHVDSAKASSADTDSFTWLDDFYSCRRVLRRPGLKKARLVSGFCKMGNADYAHLWFNQHVFSS